MVIEMEIAVSGVSKKSLEDWFELEAAGIGVTFLRLWSNFCWSLAEARPPMSLYLRKSFNLRG